MKKSKLLKFIFSGSAAIFLSRITGLIRDIVFTSFFGISFLADAFVYAYRFPNLLRLLFGEGALSAAFIPLYKEKKLIDKKQQIAFALNLLSNLSLFLAVLCLIFFLFCSYIVKFLAPGLDINTFVLTVKLTKIMLPFLFLIGISSTLVAILNSHNYYFIPALSSALLNISMIGSILVYYYFTKDSSENSIIVYSLGVVLGGIFQVIINFPLLKKIGYSFKFKINFFNKDMKLLWNNLLPSVIGVGVRQITLYTDLIFASFLVVGSVASLDYANRLMQFPLAIFGYAVWSVSLPVFSEFSAKKDWAKLNNTLQFSLILISYLMIPATFISIVFRNDIIKVLFLRGNFKLTALQMTSSAFLFYIMGIFFYSINKILVSFFYSQKNTKTPVLISIIIVFFNIIANFIFIRYFKHKGLALATSVCAVLQMFILFAFLKKKYLAVNFGKIHFDIIKIFIINIFLFFFLYSTKNRYFIESENSFLIILQMILLVISYFAIYYLFCLIFKVSYSKKLFQKVCQKFQKKD